MNSLLQYTLRIADSSLILGQRMSQWCSNGPTLEEDIAMSNISLDLFGQANGFYEYASQLDGSRSADNLAFMRNEREFYNLQISEQVNGHFGATIVRNFFHDAFMFLFYTELKKSKDETLSALAAKSLKEVKYHLRHSNNWLIRLGDGTQVSNSKVQEALNDLWDSGLRNDNLVMLYLLNKNNIEMDRKVLAHLAFHEPETFKSIVNQVRK